MIKNVNEKVREVYEELAAKSEDGGVTPYDLLEVSRAEDSPLHNKFDWDDSSAGEKYRIYQARNLLRTMMVEIDKADTREYQNIIIEVDHRRVQKYYHIDTVMSSKELKRKVLIQMAKRIRDMMNLYNNCKEMYKIVDVSELEKLEEKMEIT